MQLFLHVFFTRFYHFLHKFCILSNIYTFTLQIHPNYTHLQKISPKNPKQNTKKAQAKYKKRAKEKRPEEKDQKTPKKSRASKNTS